jgi:hypothetical protein
MESHALLPLPSVTLPFIVQLVKTSGFQRNSKWERRIQIPNQISLISTACVPLRPTIDDEPEARKLTVFDQQAMRRTAWDCIWIHDRDLDLEDIESQATKLVEQESKVKIMEYNGAFGGPDDIKADRLSSSIIGGKRRGKTAAGDETSDWGTDGLGVKVWLRRTIIYQLINLEERID